MAKLSAVLVQGDSLEPRPAPAGRFRRVIAGLGATLGLAAVFTSASLFCLGLHINLPPARRLIQRAVNEGLRDVFQGQVVAEGIEKVSLRGVRIQSAVALDAEGRRVVDARGIHARADVLALGRELLFGREELRISLSLVRVDEADILLAPGPSGAPSIADLFLPRDASPPPPGAPSVRVSLPRIEVGHAWVHGEIAPPRALDADVNRLAASLQSGPEGVVVRVEQTGLVERRLLPAALAGSAHAYLRVLPAERVTAPGAPGATDASPEPTVDLWTEFTGQLANLQVQAHARLADQHLSGKIEIPRATPAELGSVIPDLPLAAKVAAAVELDGDLPAFAIGGRITLDGGERGEGAVTLEGRLDAAGPLRVDLDVDVAGVDPHAFMPAPAGTTTAATAATARGSAINASGRLQAEIGDVLRLSAEARTAPFSFEGNAVPAADVHLVLDRGVLLGAITAHEPGMPTSGAFAFSPPEGLRFTAVSDIASLRGVPRLDAPVGGSAEVQITGTLRAGALDARVSGLVDQLQIPGDVLLQKGGVEGRITGRTSALSEAVIDASLWGRGFSAAGTTYGKVAAEARGPWRNPHVTARLVERADTSQGAGNAGNGGKDDAGEDGIEASGELDTERLGARKLKVHLKRGATVVDGDIARVEAAPGGVAIQGLNLRGAGIGQVDGGLQIQGKEVFGKLHGEGVSLERVAALAGLPRGIRGVADVDVELTPSRKGRKGHVQVALEDGQIGPVGGLSALFNATFDDDRVKADGLARLVAHAPKGAPEDDRCDGTIATLKLEGGAFRLPGPLLDPRSYAAIEGSAQVVADDADLRCLARIPPLPLFVSDMRGKLSARATVERPKGQRFPSIRALSARTRGLEVSGPTPLLGGAPAWASHAIDVQLKGSLDGETGKAEATATLFDGELLGDVYLATTLDLPALRDRPKERWARLRTAPVLGHASIPRRSLASFTSLPTLLRDALPSISGEVRADVYLDGTLSDPFVVAHVQGWDVAQAAALGSLEAGDFSLPVTFDASGTYEDRKLTLEAQAGHDGRAFLAGSGELDVDLGALSASGKLPAWTGRLSATLTEAPLGAVPFFSDREIQGHLNGTLSLTGLHDRPALKVDLSLPDLQIGPELFFKEGALSLDISPLDDPPRAKDAEHARDQTRLRAQARLLDHEGGRLDASAFAAVHWEDGLSPAIEKDAMAALHTRASRLRLSALYPFVAGTLSKLDGYLDGEVWLDWNRLAEGDQGKISAKLQVTEGVFHVPQMGQEFHDARVSIEHEPGDILRFSDFEASGLRGQIKGSGEVTLDGLRFKSADAKLSIASGDELPITLEGVPMGNAWGEVSLHADKGERAIEVTATVPSFHFALPDAAARDVQSLDDRADVVVSHPLGQVKLPRDPDALAYAITLDLGRVDIEGAGIDVSITGSKEAPPRIELTDKARLSGDINVLRGKFEVVGKKFEIERGMVRLRPEDTANPYINVRARWDSQAARVYVDYAGVLRPITHDKLRFTSDPPRPTPEIMSLLLFGGEQYPTFTQNPQGGQSAEQIAGGYALSAGGGLVAAQFNALISGIAPLRNFSTQLSTAEDGTLRPGVAYTLGDQLHVVATYDAFRSGATSGATATTPQTGGASGRSSSTAELNLDWRFRPNWLLRGTISVGGEQGEQYGSTGLDLLWQYRY